MKKIAFILLTAVLLCMAFSACGTGDYTATINVYNWGQYISDGSDGCLDINKAFTEATGIKVNYSTFDSNETLYTKLKSGGVSYDVIVPSDYMVGMLAAEGLLEELNFDNIPNYEFVDEEYKHLPCDPEAKYSVPYTWGTVGIIYNSKYVTKPVTSWEIMWDEDYAGKILMFDNPRDAFAIAEFCLGYSINTTDEAELQACAEILKEQKPVLQQYVMDEIFAIMQNEEAWIAPYYAGDCLVMMGENENLDFFLPGHQGFNMFIDAMCIPTCAKEKEAAELFINFLCDPEIAGANMDWICYGTPLSAAKEFMDPETVSDPVTYPDAEALVNGSSFAYLPEDISRYMESLFMDVRNS